MRILFDHNVDRRFRRHLPGHEIRTTREMGWEQLQNGVLIKTAADQGFEALLTIDKNIEYEQNLKRLSLPIIILDCRSNALPSLVPFAAFLVSLLRTPLERVLYVIELDGTVHRLRSPRPRL